MAGLRWFLSFLALACLQATDLPIFDVGSDWEKLGKLSARRIHEFQRISPTVAQLRKIILNKNVSQAFDKLWAWQSFAFPDYVEELKLMAKGANVTVKDLALFALKNELLDGEVELANVSYWVKAKSFEAMAYPGMLPGATFGFNQHGIVLTVNALSPKDVAIEKGTNGCAGKYFISRKILDAESVDSAIEFLNKTCSAYGMSMNIGSTRTGEQVNIEVGPGFRLSVHRVKNASYFHANSYLHLDVAEVPHMSPSSAHRQARARKLMPARDRSDVLAILGDAKDVRWPIYRTAGHGDSSVTLASGVFDFDAYKVDVWSGSNPLTSAPLFTRPLPKRHETDSNKESVLYMWF